MSAVAGRKPIQVGELSDDELVRLARGGDADAFDAIVHRYRAPLVGYCRRWLDPHRAEEVVQHTFMKAFLCVRDDDRPLVLRPWLYRVAHNAALNALEKKGSDWEELDENYDGVPQPPQVAEQRARFLRVVDEIDALPERQREALLLNEFEGRCYADIASELGTSESGVRGLLRRARSQLRDAAAVILPFPALRELARTDPARGLQVDRAGEVVGSAGAAGGIAAVGGLTKVAAGMLAAGTIAGGSTAINADRDISPTSRAEAPAVAPADSGAERPVAPARRTLPERVSAGRARVARSDARPQKQRRRPVAAVRLPSGDHGGISVGRSGAPAPGRSDATGKLEPAPALPPLPRVPLVPLVTGENQPTEEEQPAAESEPTAEEDTASAPSGENREGEPAGDTEAASARPDKTTGRSGLLPRSA